MRDDSTSRSRRRRTTRRGPAAGAGRARPGRRGARPVGGRSGRGIARDRTTWATGASSCRCPLSGRDRRRRPAVVRGQVVADERDPALDQAAARERRRPPPAGDRAPRRTVPANGPSPMSHPTCRSCRGCRRPAAPWPRRRDGRPCRPRSRSSRRSAAHSTRRQRGRQLVVVGGVLGVDRHRPLEDRRARRQQIGDATAHQRITGEVLVGVDHARV